MQRIIKFRVWDKRNNKFLKTKDGLYFDLDFYQTIAFFIKYSERFVVQQFTGFKDKNDKEIYEGDIFQYLHYKWDAIQFENGKFIVNLKGARVFDLYELFEGDYEIPLVVGNILKIQNF